MLILSVLNLSSVFCLAKAQEQEKNRYNLELGTGLSNFKDAGNSLNPAGNFTLSIWTPNDNIYSLEAFFSGWTDYMTDYSILYGKMLPFKREKKSFVSIHGGIGYLNLFKKENDIEIRKTTIGLTVQLKAGWAFEKGWIGFVAFQKYSFTKGNNIRGVNLLFSLNLNLLIPN